MSANSAKYEHWSCSCQTYFQSYSIKTFLFLFSDFLFVIFLLVSSLRNKQTHQKTKNQLANPGKNQSTGEGRTKLNSNTSGKMFFTQCTMISYFMFEWSTWVKKNQRTQANLKLNELLFAYIDQANLVIHVISLVTHHGGFIPQT